MTTVVEWIKLAQEAAKAAQAKNYGMVKKAIAEFQQNQNKIDKGDAQKPIDWAKEIEKGLYWLVFKGSPEQVKSGYYQIAKTGKDAYEGMSEAAKKVVKEVAKTGKDVYEGVSETAKKVAKTGKDVYEGMSETAKKVVREVHETKTAAEELMHGTAKAEEALYEYGTAARRGAERLPPGEDWVKIAIIGAVAIIVVVVLVRVK